MDHWLFSYGTLQQAGVQRAVFGREVEACHDRMTGFRLDHVAIDDAAVVSTSGADVHPILVEGDADDTVAGVALRLTDAEVALADRYEVDAYQRVGVVLASGRAAFVYVRRERGRMADVQFVTPDPALGTRLRPVARRIFTETFGGLYAPTPFDVFCETTYADGGPMDRDLRAADIDWQVAVVAGEPIGYAKLTPLRAPAIGAAAGALEMQQLYVTRAWHGTGVAARLFDWVVATAHARGAPELYLTVFDHNERAKRFYARRGFVDVGRCTFTLGDRIDEDRIWRRLLTDPAIDR